MVRALSNCPARINARVVLIFRIDMDCDSIESLRNAWSASVRTTRVGVGTVVGVVFTWLIFEEFLAGTVVFAGVPFVAQPQARIPRTRIRISRTGADRCLIVYTVKYSG